MSLEKFIHQGLAEGINKKNQPQISLFFELGKEFYTLYDKKPISLDTLDIGYNGRGEEIILDPYRLDFLGGAIQYYRKKFEVSVNGDLRKLSPQSWTLLEYFCHNQTQIIPSKNLELALWGKHDINSKAVYHAFRRLKQIIEPEPQNPALLFNLKEERYWFGALEE